MSIEPTTGEIVRILRGYADDIRARAATDIPTPPEAIAAGRLESQEQTIAALTARAEKAEKIRDIWEKKWWEEALEKVEAQVFKEKAERERDAAVADLVVLKDCGFCNSCVGCNAPHSEEITYCADWTRRGLPQDGEGKI